MPRLVSLFCGALLALGSPAWADPGSEIAVVLDNSASMVAGSTIIGTGQQLPPNDPERAAVLGALLLDGLARGSADQVTVIGFGDADGAPPRVVSGAEAIRAMPYGGGTWMKPAFGAAAAKLGASARDRKVLVAFTDGAPSDFDDADAARALLAEAPTDLFAIGLYAQDFTARQGEAFLRPLVSTPADLTLIDATRPDAVQQVVRAFTESYARVLGSKPLVGQLKPGGSAAIEVGRYVTEVLVAVASERPGPAFSATLTGPAGPVQPRATGDNGCPPENNPGNAPTACNPPRRHYATFRANQDPYAAATWTLALAPGAGAVEYGVILRYDLTAEVQLPATVKVGKPVPVEAGLLFRGQRFVDPEFFTADGFAAVLRVGDQEVPLTHAGDGRFTGTWSPALEGAFDAEIRFTNKWLTASAERPVTVEGWITLVLGADPVPVALGTWAGARGGARRCAEVSITGPGAGEVEVECLAQGRSAEAVLSCSPVSQPADAAAAPSGDAAGAPASPAPHPTRFEVCVEAASCCGELPADGDDPFRVTLRGAHPHYHDGAMVVPVTWAVTATGLLACWWIELAGLLTALALLAILWGLLTPNDFDPALSVRIAGKADALRRASSLTLAEQPGGRRGFYRDARLCLLNDGTPVRKPGQALLVIAAGPKGTTRIVKAGGLERQERRTQKWVVVAPEELAQGIEPNVTYRAGPLYLQFR